MDMLGAGAMAPSFDAIDSFLEKGPVLLAFYKVSCPTCQLAFPFLDRLSKGSLQVIGVSQDEAAPTKAFNDRFGVSFETIRDPASSGYKLSNAFGISSVPSLFLIEPDGKISHAGAGFDKAELEQLGKRAGVEVFRGDNVPAYKPG